MWHSPDLSLAKCYHHCNSFVLWEREVPGEFSNRTGDKIVSLFSTFGQFTVITEMNGKYKADYDELLVTNSCLHHSCPARSSWLRACRGIQCPVGDLNARIGSKLFREIEGIVSLYVCSTNNWWPLLHVVYWDADNKLLLFEFRISIDYLYRAFHSLLREYKNVL